MKGSLSVRDKKATPLGGSGFRPLIGSRERTLLCFFIAFKKIVGGGLVKITSVETTNRLILYIHALGKVTRLSLDGAAAAALVSELSEYVKCQTPAPYETQSADHENVA